MKIKSRILNKNFFLLSIVMGVISINAHAAEILISNLVIQKVRAVGDYVDPKYANTVEIWLATPIDFPSNINCPSRTLRVAIDAKNVHMVAAAYLAVAKGKRISVNVDDRLPNRDGMCEISFLDIEQ